jgi:hypothetical protein
MKFDISDGRTQTAKNLVVKMYLNISSLDMHLADSVRHYADTCLLNKTGSELLGLSAASPPLPLPPLLTRFTYFLGLLAS